MPENCRPNLPRSDNPRNIRVTLFNAFVTDHVSQFQSRNLLRASMAVDLTSRYALEILNITKPVTNLRQY